MKEQWISVSEFARRTGRTIDTIYSMISRTRESDPLHCNKYKKRGKERMVNWAWFADDEKKNIDTQARFEKAYWRCMEKFSSEFALAKAIASKLSIAPNTVNMYLRGCFTVSGVRATKRRLEYIYAMEEICIAYTA